MRRDKKMSLDLFRLNGNAVQEYFFLVSVKVASIECVFFYLIDLVLKITG